MEKKGEGQWSLTVRGLGGGAAGAVHGDGGGAVRVGEGGGDVAVESSGGEAMELSVTSYAPSRSDYGLLVGRL